MILKKAFVALFVVFFLAAPAFAADVGGVKLPDKVQVNGQDLTFNGGGVRTSMGFDVYVVALYLKQKSADAAAIVAADEPVERQDRDHFIHGHPGQHVRWLYGSF